MYSNRWFHEFQERVHKLVCLHPGASSKDTTPIKIAILDTGIQLPSGAYDSYEGQITFRSWLSYDKRGKKDLDRGDRDLDGHGTHCASLILKVAQNVHLYVARIYQSREERNIDETTTHKAVVDVLSTPRPAGSARADFSIGACLCH